MENLGMPGEVQASMIYQSGNWLLLDASHPRLQVMLFCREGGLFVELSDMPAVEGLMASVGKVLRAAQLSIREIDGYLYCSGPGSILGIRLCVMAIRAWQGLIMGRSLPVWHYRSLSLAGWELDHLGNACKGEPYCVVSEWRKDQWNGMRFIDGRSISGIEVWDTQSLRGSTEPMWVLPQKKAWTAGLAIPEWTVCAAHLGEQACGERVLVPAEDWPIYSPGSQDYFKWSGDRHRKPGV